MNDYDRLLKQLRHRRSVRRFRPETVETEDLMRLFEAARWAPSNHNRQPWRFIVMQDRGRIATLAEAVRRRVAEKVRSLPLVATAQGVDVIRYATLFGTAPVVIAALHRQPIRLGDALLRDVPSPSLVSGEPLSVAMAVQNLLLAASALRLGTCVLTAPLLAHDLIREALAVPPGCELNCLIALGHPAESPPPPPRKEIAAFVDFADDIQRSPSSHSGDRNP